MRFTASVRQTAFIGLILAAHLAATNVFRLEDRDSASLVERKLSLAPAEEVNALLVGGSGIHYGLSARVLSERTPYNFLNLGLILEGHGWENYLGFLRRLDSFDAKDIELVIYSSSDFYKLDERSEFDLKGARKGFLLFDRQSWLQKLKPDDDPYGPWPVDRTVIEPETGDMVFLKGVCDVYYPGTTGPRSRDHYDLIASRADDLKDLFPNATILLRPWPLSDGNRQKLQEVRVRMDEELAGHEHTTFLPPEPIYRKEWACDAPFHPTAEGRDAITRQEVVALMATISAGEQK